MRGPLLVGALAATVIALVASATVAIGAMAGGANRGGSGLFGSSPALPKLPGTLVKVSVSNMGGPMMGQRDGMMSSGGMGLSADQGTVHHGTVSFLVTNTGSIDHEMVVLRLASSQTVGARPIGADAKVDEAASLGEASKTNGAGAGHGVVPGASSWMTIALAPGRYELVCNLPGHYTAGMYTQLTIT